jgi:hypothetical protein
MASKKKAPAKKAVSKKPRRDEAGNAETMKEAYRDANQRARAAQNRLNTPLNYPSITNRSPKLSIDNYVRADMQGMKDAKSAPGRQSPPRTGPVAGGQSSLYARLTGGGLTNRGK